MVETKYSEDQFDINYPNGAENSYWVMARNKILSYIIKKYQTPGQYCLEVGCGRGIVIKYLNEQGIRCYGVELANCRLVKGLEPGLVSVDTDANTLPEDFKRQFDTLMLFDVIEHIEKPHEFLQTLLINYPNVRRLILAVPARQELWSNYDTFFGHFRRYDRAMLEETVNELGFRSIDNRYAFKSLYLPMQLTLKLIRQRKLKAPVPPSAGVWLFKLIAQILYWESIILPKSWAGTSVICVADKR